MDATLDLPNHFPAIAAPRFSWPGSQARRTPWLLVLGLHALLALMLLQAWRPAPRLPAPLLIPVRWIAPDAPRPQPPEPARETRRTDAPPSPDAQAAPLPLPTSTVSDAPAPVAPAPVVVEHRPAEPLAPPVTAAPPAPARVTINAPRYLVEPRLNMPLASRRLGEQGLVQLRLHIGTNGELIEAQLARSSGFERLDTQALRDIRSARFAPLVENGRALEWDCLALLSYELSR